MTNREGFNKWLREKADEILTVVDQMDTAHLVDAEHGFYIGLRVHDLLFVYKTNSTGRAAGKRQEVIDWLNRERTEQEEATWQAAEEWSKQCAEGR